MQILPYSDLGSWGLTRREGGSKAESLDGSLARRLSVEHGDFRTDTS